MAATWRCNLCSISARRARTLTHSIKSESLTENCFREIFKNELRQDVFSFSFIFIFVFSLLHRLLSRISPSCMLFLLLHFFSFVFLNFLHLVSGCMYVLQLYFWLSLISFLLFSGLVVFAMSSTTILWKAYRIASSVESEAASHRAYKFEKEKLNEIKERKNRKRNDRLYCCLFVLSFLVHIARMKRNGSPKILSYKWKMLRSTFFYTEELCVPSWRLANVLAHSWL